MRRSNLFLSFLAVVLALFCLMFLHARVRRAEEVPRLALKAEMVKKWELTDLCLFTEARYTRHPVMADVNTPFQDYPFSLEHYPSGALMLPPEHLRRGH